MRYAPLLLVPVLLLATAGAVAQGAAQSQFAQHAAELRARWDARVAAGQAPANPTEPSITSGKILTASVDVTKPPGVPAIQLTLDSGTAGVYGGTATLLSPDGNHLVFAQIFVPDYPPAPTHYAFSTLLQSSFISGSLGLYAQPGTWTIQSIDLGSGDGHFISYGNAQLAALFHAPAAFTVINPNPVDTKPPAIGNGTILTPTVSLSAPHPFALIRLPVADNLSGVANVSILFNPSNVGFGLSISAAPGVPLKRGVLTADYELPATLATGTYTIISVIVCGAAANCSTLNTPAAIAEHFKSTTITVTN